MIWWKMALSPERGGLDDLERSLLTQSTVRENCQDLGFFFFIVVVFNRLVSKQFGFDSENKQWLIPSGSRYHILSLVTGLLSFAAQAEVSKRPAGLSTGSHGSATGQPHSPEHSPGRGMRHWEGCRGTVISEEPL